MDKCFLEMASAINTENNPAIYSCSEENSSCKVNIPHIPPVTLTKGAWFYQELARHPVIYRETCTPRCNINYPVSLCQIPHGMTRLEPRINKDHFGIVPVKHSQVHSFEIHNLGSTFLSSKYVMPLGRVCPVKCSSNTSPWCTMKSSMPKSDPVIVPSDIQVVNNSYHDTKIQEGDTVCYSSESLNSVACCSLNHIGRVIEICDTSVASSSGNCHNYCEHDSGIDGMQSNNVTSGQDEEGHGHECLDMMTPPPSETSHTSDNYNINDHKENVKDSYKRFPINSGNESGIDDRPVSTKHTPKSSIKHTNVILRKNQEGTSSSQIGQSFIPADHSYSNSSVQQDDIANLLSASKCEPVRSSTPIEDDQKLLPNVHLNEEQSEQDQDVHNRSDNFVSGLCSDNDDLVSSTSKDDLKERGLEESEIILLCDSNDDADDLYDCKSPIMEKTAPFENQENVDYEVNNKIDTCLVCPTADDYVKCKFNVIKKGCDESHLTIQSPISTTAIVAPCHNTLHIQNINVHDTTQSPLRYLSNASLKNNESGSSIWSPWQPWAKQLRNVDKNSVIQEQNVLGQSSKQIFQANLNESNIDESNEHEKQDIDIYNDKVNNVLKRRPQSKLDESVSLRQNFSHDFISSHVTKGKTSSVSSRKLLPSLERNMPSDDYSSKDCKGSGAMNLPSFAMFKQATPSELQMWNTLYSFNCDREQSFNEPASSEIKLSKHHIYGQKVHNEYQNSIALHRIGSDINKSSKCNSPTAEILQDNNTKKNTKSLNPLAVYYMSEWFEKHQLYPYPTTAEKKFFAKSGSISLAQVSSWFANKRARIGIRSKKPSPAPRSNSGSPILQITANGGVKKDSSPVFAYPKVYFSKGKENDYYSSNITKESIFRKTKHKRGLSDVSNISNGSYNSSPEVEYSCIASKKQRLTSE